MTGEDQYLLEKYLTHLNVLGPEGDYPDFEAWYQESGTPKAQERRERWKRRQSCATRISWTPPGSSTGCRRTKQKRLIL